jgi:hypothetical protein
VRRPLAGPAGRLLAALGGGLALLAAGPAPAHTRSQSYSTWLPDEGGARVHVRVSQLDLSRLDLAYRSTGGPDDPVGRYLAANLLLRAGGTPCRLPLPPAPREAPEGWVVYAWRVDCGEGARELESALFRTVAPSHLHFARWVAPAGDAGSAQGGDALRVLSDAEPRWSPPAASGASPAAGDGAGTTLAGYVTLGVEHIVTGWDHLAFVAALLLLAGTLREVAGLVTSFTVAHSVTLGLATLGVVRPDAAPVEALIGFSIALVAAENAWLLAGRSRWVPLCITPAVAALALLPGAVSAPTLLGLALFSGCHFGLLRRSPRPARLRAAVAFVFGLVHGFGFAGVLAALELPTSRLVPALFGFNVGVEIGQLAVVALLWPALHALASLAGGRPARLVTELASAGICGLGIYWFLVRSLG